MQHFDQAAHFLAFELFLNADEILCAAFPEFDFIQRAAGFRRSGTVVVVHHVLDLTGPVNHNRLHDLQSFFVLCCFGDAAEFEAGAVEHRAAIGEVNSVSQRRHASVIVTGQLIVLCHLLFH